MSPSVEPDGLRRPRPPCEHPPALTTLLWIILATLVSGVLSVLAAGTFLALPARSREAALPHLVSFATGALLGAALLGLIPHSVIGAGIDACTGSASR